MRSNTRWCVLLLAATAWAARAEEGSVNGWLDRLAHSRTALNYRGVLSYERGDHLESLRITHGIIDGEAFERLEHLDGEHREVIRHGAQLLCIQVDRRLNLLAQRQLLRQGLAGLDAYYALQLDGESRVADRRSTLLLIKPRDIYRLGYRLAIDRDSGLLLRAESLDNKGRLLERLQFVEVDIARAFKPEWLNGTEQLPQQKPGEHTIDRVIEEEQMPWRPQWLPPGFVLAVAPRRPSEDVLTYSDGLAVLSVFVAPALPDAPRGAGRAAQGATVAVTRPVSFAGAPFSVTVVGEVPLATAQRVADSVSWSGNR